MKRFQEFLSSFKNITIGVIGDIAADVYIYGSPERLSREAPVMVVKYEGERIIPGCAANTMNNLLVLGCDVAPVSVLGEDKYGNKLMEFFTDQKVNLKGVIRMDEFETVAKTRVMVGDVNRTKQQVIRIDHTPPNLDFPGLEERLAENLERVDAGVDAWIVSDYGYLPLNNIIAEKLRSIGAKKPMVVDSRFRTSLFKGASCMTPNESEAVEAAGPHENDIEAIGRSLLLESKAKSLIITRGNLGMVVFEESGDITAIPTVGGDEIVDVNGAGDTVAAAVTASIVCGATPVEAAKLASCAASVVVMKTGAATCSPEELGQKLKTSGM